MRKSPLEQSNSDEDEQGPSQGCLDKQSSISLQTKGLSKATNKVVYKSRLGYKSEWEKTYPWVYCTDPKKGMFCHVCQGHGRPSSTARVSWTSKGVNVWNHATEMLKQHNAS